MNFITQKTEVLTVFLVSFHSHAHGNLRVNCWSSSHVDSQSLQIERILEILPYDFTNFGWAGKKHEEETSINSTSWFEKQKNLNLNFDFMNLIKFLICHFLWKTMRNSSFLCFRGQFTIGLKFTGCIIKLSRRPMILFTATKTSFMLRFSRISESWVHARKSFWKRSTWRTWKKTEL